MNTAHDQLTEIARAGAARFASTSLASGHGAVTRRVRRHRTVRAAATSVASIGVVGGAVWGLDTFRHGDALTPGAIPPGTTSDSPSSSPSSASAMPLEDTLTFPSGKTLDEVSAKLADAYGVPQVDARAAIAASVTSLIPEASTAEGWPMPGTFDLTDQASLSDAADMLVTARVAELTDLGVPRADWQTVITKASLVEREAKLDVDRAKIARVIDNRLAQDMRLELDSTVIYLASSDGAFTTEEQRAADSPYNTYLYQGLPPGAIGSPSDESIRAVLNPAQGDWLFFVTVNLNTGETAYASTYEGHLSNVQTLQAWLQTQETPTP